ncbi:hypothetical protein SCA6_011027 [Theobroma cacao]
MRLKGRFLRIKKVNKPRETSNDEDKETKGDMVMESKGRVMRSFKKVMANGEDRHLKEGTMELEREGKRVNARLSIRKLEEVWVPIKEEEVGWLQRSATRYVQNELQQLRGRQRGSMLSSPLVIKGVIKTLLEQYLKIFESWFEYLNPYNIKRDNRKRSPLDYAMIKVEVSSRRKVPMCPQFQVNGVIFTLRAYVIGIDVIKLNYQISTTRS